jgi:hypothetical protein
MLVILAVLFQGSLWIQPPSLRNPALLSVRNCQISVRCRLVEGTTAVTNSIHATFMFMHSNFNIRSDFLSCFVYQNRPKVVFIPRDVMYSSS